MSKDDPTIQAVRDARHRISGMVDHDPRKLVEHYRRLQESRRERVVFRTPTQSGAEGENVVPE
jgi:hypothetical protein